MTTRPRSGLTLVELLVVMATIGVLLALLLPAVQQSRESARATQCRNNLRQIGIALHAYHNMHGVFPPGCVGKVGDPVDIQGWGWGTFLLPQLEQQPLYDALDPNRNSLSAVLASTDLQPYLQTPLPVFRCTSDLGDDIQSTDRTLSGFVLTIPPDPTGAGARLGPSGSFGPAMLFACIMLPPRGPSPTPAHPTYYGVRAATSNYVASFGDFWLPAGDSSWTVAEWAGNGVFGSNYSVRLQDVADGTSNTFAIGERSWQSYASIWAGTDGWDRCEREGVPMIMATAFYPMNSSPDPYYLSCDPKGAAAFGSMHPRGAHFLMVDGSARFVADNINFANSSDLAQLGVYQRLARRADGQPLGDF